jgi:hypothetical protein
VVNEPFRKTPPAPLHTPDVLDRIQRKDPSWEAMVPAAVAEMIKAKNLFAMWTDLSWA